MNWWALPLVLFCPVLDRIRGGWKPFEWMSVKGVGPAAGAVMGLILGILVGIPPKFLPAVALLWFLGEMPGWGYPVGQALLGVVRQRHDFPDDQPEWWQVGPLKTRPWLSLFVRGAMWGLPCCMVAIWYPVALKIVLAPAIGMPLGVWLQRNITPRVKASHEAWRGAIVGLLCAL